MKTDTPESMRNLPENQNIKSSDTFLTPVNDFGKNKPVSEILYDEGGENFINYIEYLGLSKDQNLIILSSLHHYYYDSEEMKNVKTVVALKALNLVRNLKYFLHSVYHNLPQRGNFVGCFIDYEKIDPYKIGSGSAVSAAYLENGIVSKRPFINMLYSFIDLKTNNYLSRKNVIDLLEDHGFKVNDMKEHNGLTYFYSQKTVSPGN